MVNFPDTHITCSHCNAVVPWSLACINCGQKLPDKPLYEHINVRSRDDTVLFNIDVEEEPEGKLAKYLMYRVKLVEVAEKREISHEVFRELYQDYIFKTNELMAQYSGIGKQVTEAHKILLDTKRYLEEKKEEKAKNNITDEDFREEFERLKGIIEKVQRSLVKLGEQQQEIGLGEKTEKDTKILNRIHQMCQYYRHKLPKLVEYSVVPEDMEGILAEDLDQVIKLFSDIDDIDEYVLETEIPDLNIQDELESQEEDPIFEDIKMVVKGHDEEIRRSLRAIRVQDHVLLLGSHGEGKTEMLRQLKNFLGGISYHCSGETGERELIAGYNPTASIGEDPVHEGVLMNVSKQNAPILFLDDVTDLGSSAQGLLIEALTDRTFTNPVDGQTYRLPKEFVVVASGNLHEQSDLPDSCFMDCFGKIILWSKTPKNSIQALIARFALPEHVFNFVMWMKGEVEKYSYLYPINVRNLVKFAREYHEYREIYQKENQLKQLAIDRLIKMRVINSNGLVDYRKANKKILDYEFFKKITI